jgi:cytochrome c5
VSTKYTPLKDHDTPIKVLFTGYLVTVSIGYFFALIQILLTHGMADGKFGLSIDDIVYSYYGNRSGTVLEQQLNGAMKANAPDDERFQIIQWDRDGADQDAYKDDGIDKIIQQRCVMCHNKEASGLPNFNEFEQLKKYTAQDEGATLSTLTRGSHIHMFGIGFIFMFVGIIFSFSETANVKMKCIAVGMPYVFLIADIISWWLTKFFPQFAWLVIIAGMGMGVSFMFMWATSILEMWLFKPVYVDGIPYHYERLKKEYAEGRLQAKLWSIPGKLIDISKTLILFVQEHIVPVVKILISKIKPDK